jgi:excisionase family DNA binding protein
MTPGEKEVLNVPEAAQFLGISERSLRRLIAGREVPFARVGGSLRLRRAALLEWLAEAERHEKGHGEKPSAAPIEAGQAEQVRAIAGKYVHVPFSSEDLIREKQEELRQEDMRWNQVENGTG